MVADAVCGQADLFPACSWIKKGPGKDGRVDYIFTLLWHQHFSLN